MSTAVVSARMRGKQSFRAEELLEIADWLGVPASQLLPSPSDVAA